MSKKSTINSLLVTLSLVLAINAAALGQQRRSFQSQQSSTNRSQAEANTVFRSARDLITDGDWARAQAKFNEYVSQFPNEKNLDAALYWMAYADYKLEKFSDCRTTIIRLLEKYPSSNWNDDARLLLAQMSASMADYDQLVRAVRAVDTTTPAAAVAGVGVAEPPIVYRVGQEPVITPMPATAPVAIGGQGIQGLQGIVTDAAIGYGPAVWALRDELAATSDDDPCEFKIVVLQALFQTDLQRGILAATDWLKQGSNQTVRCKSAALTLLGRHGGKSVTPVILGVARSEPDLKLRARAIATLGTTNDDSVIDALRDFALTSQENDIIEASLYALSKHTGERAVNVLTDIATSGKTVNHRKIAISSIATRPGEPAVDALFKIYDGDQNVEIRKAVIFGFANRRSERAGTKLVEIARGSDSIDLRKAAITSLSRRAGEKTTDFLLSLYDSERNEELKDQIVNSLASGSAFVYSGGYQGPPVVTTGGASRLNDQRVVQKFIEIAKNPQAPMERRKRVIGWLSRSKDPAVLKFLEELLK